MPEHRCSFWSSWILAIDVMCIDKLNPFKNVLEEGGVGVGVLGIYC